jgi:hypothetical protein
MDADDLLTQVKGQPRFRMEVGLLLDASAFDEARTLNSALQSFSFRDDDDVTQAGPHDVAQRLLELYRDTPEVTFTLEARTATEWERLRAESEGDDDRFTVGLLAACIVDPSGWTVAKIADLRDSLTAGQWHALVVGARQVNEGLFDLRPTLAATALMRGMRPNLTTAPNEG